MLDDLGCDVDRVADQRGAFDVEGGVEEREPGVLHRRQQQAFGKGVDQRRGHRTAFDRPAGIILDGEQFLGEPAQVDEVHEIRLGDGAPVRAVLWRD